MYVGLGISNPVHPCTLLPIYISSAGASLGIPIPTDTLTFDLASCRPGLPLSISNIDARNFNIGPNPTDGIIVLNTKGGIFVLYDLTGKEILLENLPYGNSQINLSKFPRGYYLYKFSEKIDKIKSGKIILIK
jgi:hypothetical protein